FKQAKTQQQKYFNHHPLYLHPFIPLPKHLQLHIIPHAKNNYLHLPQRHSSLQPNNQKLIQQPPSPPLTQQTTTRISRHPV
ncbi:ATP-binding protein, partial [Staphylococcus epidermidis]